jgi:hypothetical protein
VTDVLAQFRRESVPCYGNQIHASTSNLTVLGANNPVKMTMMPEAINETDKTASGQPDNIRSKP